MSVSWGSSVFGVERCWWPCSSHCWHPYVLLFAATSRQCGDARAEVAWQQGVPHRNWDEIEPKRKNLGTSTVILIVQGLNWSLTISWRMQLAILPIFYLGLAVWALDTFTYAGLSLSQQHASTFGCLNCSVMRLLKFHQTSSWNFQLPEFHFIPKGDGGMEQ